MQQRPLPWPAGCKDAGPAGLSTLRGCQRSIFQACTANAGNWELEGQQNASGSGQLAGCCASKAPPSKHAASKIWRAQPPSRAVEAGV
eukprot:1157467-Pelagomonas_calceolata.AAC.11